MPGDPSSEQNLLLRWVRGLTEDIASELLRLATSALRLVAALAWNEAVQSAVKEFFPTSTGVAAKFLYALLVSVLILLVTINLTRLARLAKGKKS